MRSKGTLQDNNNILKKRTYMIKEFVHICNVVLDLLNDNVNHVFT